MTSHCAGAHCADERKVRKRDKKKSEEMRFKTTAEDGERGGGSSDVLTTAMKACLPTMCQ